MVRRSAAMDDAKAQELIDVLRVIADKLDNIDKSVENVWRGLDNVANNLAD